MTNKVVAACIQTNSGPEIEDNLAQIGPMIRKARQDGAELITLPENASLMICGRDRLFARTFVEAEHPAIRFFSDIAKETGAWILVGSIAVHTGGDRLANRSYMFGPDGTIAARYDKIHMFDAHLGEKESYRESANYQGGDRAVLAETPWGKVGLTICYDLRFPHLHRTLAKAGANIITVPAAFTVPTGRLHWHILLRARAIETGCFILAPAQCGVHDTGRMTYGHSLIIAPNGEIITEAADTPGIIMAELDMVKVAEARAWLPSLQHDCDFEGP